MKTKAIPAIVMLTAGFIFCIFSIYKGQDFLTFAKCLIVVMLIFYVMGGIAAFIIQKNFVEMKDKKEEKEEQQSEETEGEKESKEGKDNKPEA